MALNNGKHKKHYKRTISFIQLWDEIISSFISKRNSNFGVIRTYNMYCDILGMYSGEDNVNYFYTLDGYPNEVEISFRTVLRSQCKEGVRISFISELDKTQIDWTSARTKARMRVWRTIDENAKPVDEFNLYENLTALDSQNWKKDSLVYLSTAELRRKRKMFIYKTLMIVSGKRGEAFNQSVVEIEHMLKMLNITYARVIGDIPDYLNTFSPFANSFSERVSKQCGNTTLPDELLARFSTYSQGIIGKSGIYFGTDIYSSFPCLKPVKEDTDKAENWLITAETGGGKSFFVKGVLVQLLARNEFNGTIMDIEGFEYIPMATFLSNSDEVIIVNMGEGSGVYYDPVEIILTGDAELDRDMYSLSTSFTLSLFKCLLGNSDSIDEWADVVINDAVSLTYSQRGVDSDDISTWNKSKGLTLYDVYNMLKLLKSNSDNGNAIASMFTTSIYDEHAGKNVKFAKNDVNRLITANEGYQVAIDFCLAKISRYFEPNGIRSSLFKNRIIIDNIKNAKLVVCSFGMAGKSENSVDPIQMALMQLYSAKYYGKFNFKLWEEFQRWGGFPDADKTINVALTGGRKLGDINIIITNKVIDMLRDDKFGVFSNTTSFAIGAIGDSFVREELCNRLTIQNMLGDLNSIALNNQDLSAYIEGDTLLSNPYKKAFLIGLDRTMYTISRMVIPKGLASSKIFKTGVEEQ